MDGERFDAMTRGLAAGADRRRLLGGLLGGALGLFGVGGAGASHDHTCRHAGATCTRDGQCCSKRCSKDRKRCLCTAASCTTTDPCKEAVCSGRFKCTIRDKADGAACGQQEGGGTLRCCAGACPAAPTCRPARTKCDASESQQTCAATCCTGKAFCMVSPCECAIGFAGDSCASDADCALPNLCRCGKCCVAPGSAMDGRGCSACCGGRCREDEPFICA